MPQFSAFSSGKHSCHTCALKVVIIVGLCEAFAFFCLPSIANGPGPHEIVLRFLELLALILLVCYWILTLFSVKQGNEQPSIPELPRSIVWASVSFEVALGLQADASKRDLASEFKPWDLQLICGGQPLSPTPKPSVVDDTTASRDNALQDIPIDCPSEVVQVLDLDELASESPGFIHDCHIPAVLMCDSFELFKTAQHTGDEPVSWVESLAESTQSYESAATAPPPPRSIETDSNQSLACPCCLSGFDKAEIVALLRCGHIFCEECIREWATVSSKNCTRMPVCCPVCRFIVEEAEI